MQFLCSCYAYSHARSENLVLDQLIVPKLIFFLILITHLVDFVLILPGEIMSWSLLGVKGFNTVLSHMCASIKLYKVCL